MLWSSRALLQIAAFVLAVHSMPALAQSYPDRPVRIVIPFAAGGPNDLLGRPLAEKMSEALGQPFVIENKGGAAGSLGTQFVAKAAPDGYTMLMTTGSITGNVAISANPAYNPVTDFAPITLLAQSYGIVLMTRPDFPAKTLTEFVALAKKNPGKYSYGHAGIGNVTYVAAELFAKLAGIELLKVPYRGTASFAPDIMSGHVNVGFMSTLLALPNMQNGQLRALGISGARRAPSLPDVPTFQEQGFKEMDVTGYFGLLFPAATPRERVTLIQQAAVKALQTPLLKKVLDDSGVRVIGSTPEEFARFLEDDMRWQVDTLKRIGLQPQ
ncbi:MAG: tripartite tricarboxylate transporter substrate binding protein [Xanthobacteraceae bacterium]|nr:tripartite tricarboxylate transporter substrate binding protein [Xanthobacteraceae bacterium]